MKKRILHNSMAIFLVTMVVSIKIVEAAPASQIDGVWAGSYGTTFFKTICTYFFKGDSVKIIRITCGESNGCLNSHCDTEYIKGHFILTKDSLFITGNYTDSNFKINTLIKECNLGSMEVGTYNWNWHYTLLNDTIFILGTSEDSDLTKLFRITTSVKKVAISNLSANAYQQTLFKTNLPFIALNPLEQSL